MTWTRRLRSTGCAVGLSAALAACAPGPTTPAAPAWTAADTPRTVVGTTVTDHAGAWTDADDFATLQISRDTSTAAGQATLVVRARTGPNNSQLGATQVVPVSIDPTIAGPMGGSFIGVPGTAAMEFFAETNGTWSSIGTFTKPADYQFAALDDGWLVLRSSLPGSTAPVLAYPVAAGPAGVTVGAPQVLTPDPAWPSALRSGFATGPLETSFALDGDLLAVGAYGDATVGGGVQVFRAANGLWSRAQNLVGPVSSVPDYGAVLAVDDGVTIDRLAVRARPPAGGPVVDVLADTGAGFAPERTVTRDPNLPDTTTGGSTFGAVLGLDGDVLALAARTATAPTTVTTEPAATYTVVQVHRLRATTQREADIALVATPNGPLPAGTERIFPTRIQVSGTNVAVGQFHQFRAPANCSFPCIGGFGFDAWSVSRTAAG